MTKNKHAGETCVIICNGKSLLDVPLSFLDSYVTFGTNKIYLHYTPTYYAATNPLVLEQNKDEIAAVKAKRYLREGCKIGAEMYLHINSRPPFSTRPDVTIYEGGTITYVCLQLAYWMGFETVLLVGLDHSYRFTGQPNQVLYHNEKYSDKNHFSPDYFRGQKWHAPDLKRSETYYKLAKTYYDNAERQIINLTPDSALDVFTKGNIEDWILSSQ